MATAILNPTSDGTVRRLLVDETWATIHDNPLGNYEDNGNAEVSLSLNASGTTNQWAAIGRVFWTFDTSVLPRHTDITSAVLSVQFFNNSNSDGLSLNPKAGIYSAFPASTTLVDADYPNIGNFLVSNQISRSALVSGSYNDFTLTPAGLGFLKRGIPTSLGMRWDADATNTTPTWVSSGITDYDVMMLASATPPKLTLTYSVPSPDALFSVPSVGAPGGPNNPGDGISLASNGAWGFSTYTDILPTGWPYDFALTGFTYQVPTSFGSADVTYEQIFEIAIGSGPTLIAQIPTSHRRDTNVGYHFPVTTIMLSEPIYLPANTRVRMRLAHSVATAVTYNGIKLIIRELSLPQTKRIVKSQAMQRSTRW